MDYVVYEKEPGFDLRFVVVFFAWPVVRFLSRWIDQRRGELAHTNPGYLEGFGVRQTQKFKVVFIFFAVQSFFL